MNISSLARHGSFGQTNYSAAKAGVAAMAEVWAKELARYNIRTGAVAPGAINTEMVAAMKSGSVVVDLAAESGGNVEGALPGEVVRVGGAQVWGGANVPAQMPGPASRLYAQNVVSLIDLLTHESALHLDLDDEIVDAACVTHAGEVRHAPTRAALEVGP